MVRKKPTKTTVQTVNSPEFKTLVDQSIAEMDSMTKILEQSGVSSEEAKAKVASIYMNNLKMADNVVTCAKKNVAELMTRIQLERTINPDTELVSDKYIKLFKLQNEALKLIKDLEPTGATFKAQVDDDKMVFDVKEGVYTQK